MKTRTPPIQAAKIRHREITEVNPQMNTDSRRSKTGSATVPVAMLRVSRGIFPIRVHPCLSVVKTFVSA